MRPKLTFQTTLNGIGPTDPLSVSCDRAMKKLSVCYGVRFLWVRPLEIGAPVNDLKSAQVFQDRIFLEVNTNQRYLKCKAIYY